MSYQFIKEKLDKNSVIILDGGNGGELEQIGAKMDNDLWAGKCAIDDPDKLFQVHENYIKSGADVITSNTYAITPISMKEYGYEKFTQEWNKKTVDIALKAAALKKGFGINFIPHNKFPKYVAKQDALLRKAMASIK